MKILVTGTAGFIGSALAHVLLERGDEVIGVDNVNDYYDVRLKEARLARLLELPGFTEVRIGLEDRAALLECFEQHQPQRVVNLAAQAGVRYSLTNPHAYIDANLAGFCNVLEACRHYAVEHLVYASSSSVYGANTAMPFSIHHNVDHPVSLYAATKKANELMAHTYSHLFGLPTTGLRFFTVYGPWGRPDMALFMFTQRILQGKPIDVFNFGQHKRDFTYIDDIIEGVVKLLDCPPTDALQAPCRIFNIGANRPEKLMDFIKTLERALSRATGRPVVFDKIFEPLKQGDVPATYASTDLLEAAVGFRPSTPIEAGLQQFADWYVGYYQVK